MILSSEKKVENRPNKNYVAQTFKPKAHYKTFDWDNYVPVVEKKEQKPKKEKIKKTKAPKVKKEPKLKQYGSFVSVKKQDKKIVVEKKSASDEKEVKAIFSISVKLISIISGLLALALILITILVSYFISADTRANALENNLTINSRTASDSENRFNNTISSVGMLMDLMESSGDNVREQKKNATMFFERNNDIVAVLLPKSDRVFYNTAFFVAHELDSEILNSFSEQEEENVQKAKNGDVLMENVSSMFQTPAISMFFPIFSSAKDDSIIVIYSAEALSESFASGSINQSILVNNRGTVLIHSDLEAMMNGEDYSENPIVKEMTASTVDNSQLTFNIDGEEYIGAYRKLNTGDGCVITMAKSSVVLEAVRNTTRRNIYLTFAILSISIIIIWFFAKTLSEPLKRLTAVTNQINEGNFDSDLLDEIPSDRKDEIGVLAKSTKNEQNILTTFTKLTNKGVTRAIIRKEIDFEPHLKDITIFFSDIRGFTAISDGFKNRFGEKSAGEIIGFLNDYMSRMVNCIKITNGNVDKFEGDAIMACWGVLRDDSLAYENMAPTNPEYARLKKIHDDHVTQDALNAIQATVAMRYSLAQYNKDAEAFTKAHANDAMAKYKPHIRIGSGLNSGRATVGFMGSNDKMEFTSIGDAVNLASRTESSNKPCGTDILITQDTYDLLKKDFIRCEENHFAIKAENMANEVIVEMIPVTFEVKGKGKQHFYGVVNMPQFDIEEFFKKTDPDFKVDEDCAKVIGPKGPKNLHEVRSILGIAEPDFGGVNLDEEENKIQIKTN